MATKSEIWEAKKLIKSGVEDIMEHLQRKTNWASRAVILRAFEGIKRTISPIITHIIDNDDYTTAVEINSIITPVFDGYFGNEPSEADFDREPEKNILRAENRSAYDFRDLVMDLRNWISEYEKQIHETQQVEQTQHHETKEARNKKNNISPKVNIEELKKHFNAKFKGAGANIDYFSTMVSDIEGLCTIKDCMAVALMIYNNENYFIAAFNTFSDWCKRFFECIGVEVQEGFNFSRKYEPTKNIKKVFTYLM